MFANRQGQWARRRRFRFVRAISAAARWLRALAVIGGGVQLALAHDPGLSVAEGELRAEALVLVTGFAPADAEYFLPPNLRPGVTWTPVEFDSVREQLEVVAPQLWEARGGAGEIQPREMRVELLPGDNVSFRLVFPLRESGGTLTLRARKLQDLPGTHRQFVVISDSSGAMLARKLIRATDATLELPLNGANSAATSEPATLREPARSATAWEFIKLGVEHIWIGYDHLLFLFALLLVCRSFRSIVAIVSCFTVAHSLTLALATLELVNLPSRFVEAAIAASILFVGLENVLRRGEEPRGRWALTFGFGLIHGFGFASVLNDLGVGTGRHGIAMPLLTFNLGVEIGQIVIAAAVLPIIWQLRKREGFVRIGVPVLSAVVALAGLYWLLDRTVFG